MARAKRKTSEEAVVDLTPMIDVVFQLIIFFVVTVNMDQSSILENIELPFAPNSIEEKQRSPGQIEIQIDKEGHFYIARYRYSLAGLKQVLQNTVRITGPQNMPILIRGDERTRHKAIRQVMDACAELGIAKIRFAAMKTEN